MEEPSFVSAVQAARPSAILQRPQSTPLPQAKVFSQNRSHSDAKTPGGLSPCYLFVRTGVCDNRACNFSHDSSVARTTWRSLAEQIMSSPYRDRSWTPKKPMMPQVLHLSSSFNLSMILMMRLSNKFLLMTLPPDL